ncbi:MAG: glutamate-5-semialdehyde dehydrogenase [Cyanobacteria bacterium]|nr:glutamate-5-semialdehyde dehydrogenase [Cyanobacteria bacterium CG_2015-16_32_12]NCO79410.1 glutamate-5-semialdehyde dehydrogenase [Cyanobacteria bacterium CG_2015-22_32_23]NCQ05667.1 glutamate-5-semialdehyde dehydrogenase [Cyanobacteria bacterium CG_2015-09_32_10]NCQ42345.1 glutamate-5-semialdehyde dehydrogenase [Cyanobacteria bacterium CG_2015-04_32_10]NCS85730.1 glutamate-5-semialdehyde dehydrogenase [Cyanobacteria bacterium CG_2015-02_32_10]
MSDLQNIAKETQIAARQLGILPETARNNALMAIASALEKHQNEIITANKADCDASEGVISSALYARLKLGESKLKSAIAGVQDVARLDDPIAMVSLKRELDEGLILHRVSCPLGVLGVIFEARPDALIQITSLAIKSGNGVILKGGKEALQTCTTLVKIIHETLKNTEVNPNAIQLLTTREEIKGLLTLDKYVDLIIPRGSNEFVRYVQENTKIPVLGHADGICHLFIDSDADLLQAINITVDAKTHYPAACNAIETLLIHKAIATKFLPEIAKALREKGVELRGDEETQKIINCESATEEDWQTEYSDLILAIKIVDNLTNAISHINQYGSKHTDAIVTNNQQNAEIFMSQVDSAGVYHNCSTRFADGFRYGFGAEVGISTQKMPPRGPVGLEGLVTYKYKLIGNGQIAATYTGDNPKDFTHKNLL